MTKPQQKTQDSNSATKVTDQPSPPGRSVARLKALAIITGVLGFILFCLTPVLPVKQEHSEFTWPQGNDLTSVTAPLISYMPEKMDLELPVEEIRNLNPGETTALSTVPENSEEATLRGMFVRSTTDGLDVVVRNVVPLTLTKEQVDKLGPDATLHITADSELFRAWIPDETNEDGAPYEGAIADDIRPMVTGIYSEMVNNPETTQQAQEAGLRASITVDSRFSSSPTALKLIAMALGLIMMVISLFALHRIDSLDGHRGGRFLPRGWWKLRPIDAVVGLFLVGWYFIGANTADDGYILTMARVSEHSGYMANYYRWFGVPESPIGFPFYDLLALMAKVSTASIWMRLPALLAGFITWMILSREVLPRLGAKINRRAVARWSMAALFLVFWMTYNNGTRPEPIIALASLLAWVSFERAIATHRLLPAAIGTIIATLALGAGPTGLMAVAALLVSLGAIIRIAIRRLPALGAGKGSSKGTIAVALLAQIAPFLAAGTAILVGVFGDQTLRTVMEATSVRSAVGPSIPWYEEYLRYTALLEPTVDGSFPRRFTILMLLFAFGVVIASTLRNGKVPGAAKGPSSRLMLAIVGTMFFMVFTPTKWTHHFGVYAGVGAALMALAAVAASHFSLSSRRNRVLFIGATLMLFALALAGTNGWWYISSYGVPWWDKTIQVAGIEASTMMLVISLAVLVWGVLVGYLSDIRNARAQSRSEQEEIQQQEVRRLLKFEGMAAAPMAILTAIVVVFSMASLAKGFVSQWPAYSVGKGNLVALTGNSCQMANDVMVESNTNDSFLSVAGGGELKDSLTTAGARGFRPNNIPTRIDPGTTTDESSSTPQTSVTSQSAYQNSDSSGSTSDSSTGASSTAGAGSSGSSGSANSDSGDSTQDSQQAGADDSGTTGGVSTERGINGSYTQLPFQLDNQRVPVLGSFTEGLQLPAYTTSQWFEIPELSEQRPLITFSAAGEVAHTDMNGVFQYGQELKVEFGRKKDTSAEAGADGGNADSGSADADDKAAAGSGNADDYEWIGEYQPLDIGTAPEWRNMRIPREVVPADADVIRIRAVDTNLTPDQWLAFTPPRAPELKSLNEVIGSEQPGLLDWSAAFQFPCQRSYDHRLGVAEVPTFRISPDHEARRAHSPVMDYYGGGSVGLTEMTVNATELPTYLENDWQRDWGVLDTLEAPPAGDGTLPKPAEIEESETTELGTYYPGPMKITSSK